MDAAKWRQVKAVFNASLAQPASQLTAFLERECGDDVELRAEVRRLLKEHLDAGDFLEEPLRIASGSHASPKSPLLPAMPYLFAGGERFEVRRRIGSGGFGDVYEAFDRERNAVMALKYLRKFEPEHLYRLKKEFRALTDIRHLNLIHVYELFSSSDPAFFTMELLTGQDFGDSLQAATAHGGASFYARLKDYLLQLCSGVMALHDAKLLHRDIKPSNVFVTDRGRLVLLDFGLVKHLEAAAGEVTVALAGTPSYLAPEQLEGGQLTEATDWYAVGVLLYEALTEQVPFKGNLLEVLARKRHEDAPAPSAVRPGIPADLDQLCRHLLRRDPAARPGGPEVLRALQDSIAVTAPADAPRQRKSRIFVAREPHLVVLQRAFDDTRQGATVCVHIRGASGVGKSALVRRFLHSIRETQPDALVLSGRCYESETAPHRGLDDLVDHLARFLNGLEPGDVQALLPRHFGHLTRLFPVLQEFHPRAQALLDIPDPREQRHRAFACLRECLGRIAERYPLILWIDDLQWGDSNTVRLLNELVQSADPFACLVLLSYRDSDTETNPALSALDRIGQVGGISVREVQLENLRFEEAEALASALVTQQSESTAWRPMAAVIARESGGNPYFVTELVRYAFAIQDRLDLSAGAFGISHVIKRRVGLLPEAAQRLLELIALAGQPLSTAICTQAAILGTEAFATRSILLREQLLRTHISDSGEELDLYHDQIREAIVGYLSREATVVYHGLLGHALEESGSLDYERLSIHFESAGQTQKAVRYTSMAAQGAVQGLAFDRAVRLYRRMLALGELQGGDRQRILEQLGEALSNAGRGKEAAETFLLASEGCTSFESLDLRRRACEQYLRSGHVDEGMTLGRQLLRSSGIAYPEASWAVVASLVWSRLQLRLRTLRAQPVQTAPDSTQKLRLDICWTVAVGMSMVDVLRSADFQARYTLLALRTGDPSRMALGLAAELAASSIGGPRTSQRADRLFAAAVQLARKTDNQHAIGFAISMRGVVSWLMGQWNDCYERNSEAATIFREKCSGAAWELTTANTFALSSLAFLGRWREHALMLPQLIRQAEERGDRYGAVSLPLLAYAYLADLRADRPDRAHALINRALSAWSDRDFNLPHCDALIGQVETFLYSEQPERAYDLLQTKWTSLRRSNLLQVQFYRILINALWARSALALAIADRSQSNVKSQMLRAAKRGVRSVAKEKVPWATALALLLRAGIATAEGRPVAARKLLRGARELFRGTGMTHYLAVTECRLAQLGGAPLDSAADHSRWMAEQDIVDPRRIADMLAPGLWHRV